MTGPVREGVVYLDTNHLSRMARNPEADDVVAMKELLKKGRFALGMSLNHLHELGAPGFIQRPELGELLDGVKVVWGPHTEDLLDRECDRAVREYLDPGQAPLMPFGASFSIAFTGEHRPEVEIPVSKMLEAFANNPQLREHLAEAAKYAVDGDLRWKREAAIVRNPESVVLSRVGRAIERLWLLECRTDAKPDPQAILQGLNRVRGMPSLLVYHGLVRTRMQDPGYATNQNSVIDEWHASAAPYTVVTALDLGTVGRFRGARLPAADRVVGRLTEAIQLLNGELDGDH